jgi:Domain of unknown function (DUF4956)
MPGKALLDSIPPVDISPDLETLVTRVPVAVLLGFVVAAVYHAAHGRQGVQNTLRTTLVLLCVLVAIVTIVIGDNLARAFGLAGALSIIRFRTVVADTRDTAFVIFAVVVGMAAGAGYLILAAVAIPAVFLAAMVMTLFDGRQSGIAATLAVKFGLDVKAEELMAALFAKHGVTGEVSAAGSAKQGAAIEWKYRVRLPSTAAITALTNELARTEGVQGVELKAKDDE